ncbi:hypothetical protein LLH00_17295 [bacterium]|nr:hypothetical protein [bacterium]
MKRDLLTVFLLSTLLTALSGLTAQCGAIKILSKVKGIVSGSDSPSQAQLDSLQHSGGRLAPALAAVPTQRRTKVMAGLATAAREAGLSIGDLAGCWNTPGWNNRTFEDFWEHVARGADEDLACRQARALSLALAARSDHGAAVEALAFSAAGEAVLLDSSGVTWQDKDSPARYWGWSDLSGLDLDTGAALGLRPAERRLIVLQRDKEVYDRTPVLTAWPLVFSAGLEPALEAARRAHGMPRRALSLVCLREDCGLVCAADSTVTYWERLEADGVRTWVRRTFAFRDIETVFLESKLRSDHASLITVSGVLDFDKLEAPEQTAFRALKRRIESVSPRAGYELGGLRLDDRYYLYELPEAAECLSREVPLEPGEVVLALASAGTARLDRESLKSLGLSAGNLFNWSGTVSGVAGRLGSQMLNRGLSRISFAAVTSKRFILYRNGEIKTYALAEGLPFALKKDKVLASGVDFYARDFFEEGKPLLEDVHQALAQRFLDASKKIVSGNYDFSIAAGSTTPELTVAGLKDRLNKEKDQRLGQAGQALQEKLPSGGLLNQAGAAAAGAFQLGDNEKGYAGMLRTFLSDKARDSNAPLLESLRQASGIDSSRAAEIERQVRRELGLDMEIKPNEMGFVGMLRRFAGEGSLERNAGLLQSLAAASGVDTARARVLTEFVARESQAAAPSEAAPAENCSPDSASVAPDSCTAP